MKLKITGSLLVIGILNLTSADAFAKGAGSSTGLTLLDGTGARAAALGEAFSAMDDEIAAMQFNPASVSSLKDSQLSLVFQQGLIDDNSGRASFGTSGRVYGLGISAGFYDGGDFELSDAGQTRTVDAQKDLHLQIAGSRRFAALSVGVAAKYLSSKIIESASASALAADFGASYTVSPALNVGASIQNIGSGMKYRDETEALPSMVRGGLNIVPFRASFTGRILLDVAYHINEQELSPSTGLELLTGPLALRAGYRGGADDGAVTVGAGFEIGNLRFDYAYGLVDDLETPQKVSMTYRFARR